MLVVNLKLIALFNPQNCRYFFKGSKIV